MRRKEEENITRDTVWRDPPERGDELIFYLKKLGFPYLFLQAPHKVRPPSRV
jgi:hypothetical protein